MVKVSKGQTDHINQRQDGKEQYSDKRMLIRPM